MNRLGAEKRRVAVVGAPSNDGIQIRDALAGLGVPGRSVNLYAPTSGEALIGEYDGEARLIQDPDVEEICAHDVVFLCQSGPLSRDIASVAGPRTLIVDVVGALDGATDLHARKVAVPHPLSFALCEILAPLEREIGLSEALAVVIRPAADFGPPGLDELRDQTVRLLNFAPFSTETFGRQLAFNVIPQAELSVEPTGLANRVAREVTRLIGMTRPAVAIQLVAAPLFYGHGIQLRFRLCQGESIERVADVLRSSGLSLGRSVGEVPATPLDVTGEDKLSLSGLCDDGIGGFWMWGIVGNLGVRGAFEAVRTAERELDGVARQ